MFLSGEKAWWSATPADLARHREQCRHREAWFGDTIVGCEAMREAVNPWLRSRTAVAPPSGHAGQNQGEVSIVELASAHQLIEEKREVKCLFDPVLGESFRDPDMRAGFQSNGGTTEIRSFDLPDVVLDASRGILLRGQQRIKETRYFLEDEDYWRDRGTASTIHDTSRGKTVIIGFNRGFNNYYHWMMQCLPAMEASIRTENGEDCVLALPPLTGWQEEALNMLGFGGLPRVQVDIDRNYHFPRVRYCTYLNGSAAFSLSPRCLSVLERMAAPIAPLPGAPERIYVARFDTRSRVIRNEHEAARLLESHGFVTLVPGLFSIRDQIALFKSARIVIGAHGAGLTNIVFCEPGTTILEFTQSNYPNMCMNRIAQGRGLRYFGECFESGANSDVHGADWRIDIGRLDSMLPALLDRRT
jgi:hypothetical protein